MSRYVAEPDFGEPPDLSDPDIIPPETVEEISFIESERVEEVIEEIEAPKEEVTELTDEERVLFQSLMTVGKRYKPIEIMGHTVVVQSLRVSDDLRIALWCKKYEESRGFQRAYQLAVCAAGIRTINGKALYESLAPSAEDEIFEAKIEKLRNYYPIVINQIYNSIVGLDAEFAELAIKLGKLKG
jgi:hypothetical protein